MSDQLSCPVEGCPRTRPDGHAMCSTHWRKVPKALQRDVYRTWVGRLRERPGARQRHLQALENAEAAVEGRDARDLFAEIDA